MGAFGRLIGAFCAMMVIGYLAVVVVFPAPTASVSRADEPTASTTATRLSQEAQALVSRRPASTLQ